MRKVTFLFLLAGLSLTLGAQQMERQNQSLFEELTNIRTKTERFNLFLNMQGNFDLDFNDNFQGGAFRMRQLRVEAKGDLNNWLSYRYRQRLNRSNDGSNMIDNVPTSIDYAGMGVKVSDKVKFFLGKQCAAYGGIEFDLNPIEIYQYSDMIDYMSNFMTGLNVTYDIIPTQQIQVQILNSLNFSNPEDMYGSSPDIIPAKLPLVYTLNWNGNFDDVLKTRWSASAMNETKKNWMFYYALGNQITSGNFNMFFDFMYSTEDLDRKGIITNILHQNLPEVEGRRPNAFDARYMSLVAKFNYRIFTQWNVFVKGMYETASVRKGTDTIEKGKYRTAWGYLGGIEFYPMASDLHFFLTYIGRSYNYTDRAKALGSVNENTNRVTVGFIYQLPVF